MSLPSVRILILVLYSLFLSACFKNESSREGGLITWDANRESSVNSSGGGYKVYYSKQAGFDPLLDGTVIDIPYSGGTKTPTLAALIVPEDGVYYFRVMAYSSLGSSDFSDEQSTTIVFK